MPQQYIVSRRRLVAALGASFILGATVRISIAHAEPSTPGEAETAALAAAQAEFDQAQEQLRQIGSLLEQTQVDKRRTEDALEELKADIGTTQDNIAQITAELEAAQAALAAYLQISYKSGAASILDVLLSSRDFNDFVTRSYYVGAVQDSQVETINDIKDLKAKLEHQEEILSDQQAQQAELLAQLESQEQTLTEQKNAADEVVAGLSVEVQQLFAAQQAQLTAAAEARALAAGGAEAGQQFGFNIPSVSQGSIVENAYACLGIPYVWGGDDTNIGTYGGYDCSGFVQHCYALEGFSIGRTTWDQIDQINALGNWCGSLEELLPGDLVFPNDGHVGIYIGNGQMIDAPFPGMYIRIDAVDEFIGGGSPV